MNRPQRREAYSEALSYYSKTVNTIWKGQVIEWIVAWVTIGSKNTLATYERKTFSPEGLYCKIQVLDSVPLPFSSSMTLPFRSLALAGASQNQNIWTPRSAHDQGLGPTSPSLDQIILFRNLACSPDWLALVSPLFTEGEKQHGDWAGTWQWLRVTEKASGRR
jgi:hypothetical protein